MAADFGRKVGVPRHTIGIPPEVGVSSSGETMSTTAKGTSRRRTQRDKELDQCQALLVHLRPAREALGIWAAERQSHGLGSDPMDDVARVIYLVESVILGAAEHRGDLRGDWGGFKECRELTDSWTELETARKHKPTEFRADCGHCHAVLADRRRNARPAAPSGTTS